MVCARRCGSSRRVYSSARQLDADVLPASINWDTYWLYLLTEAALSLSPGPAVMLVMAYGLTHGARRSLFAALGVLTANALYFAVSATALAAVLVASKPFFVTVKWLGAFYLVYIGVAALLGRASPITASNTASRDRSARSIFLSGFTLQLANPKTLIFFVAILPQFVDPSLPVGAQMIWLAIGSIVPELLILGGYGYLASRAAHLAASPRYARITDQIAGVLVLCAAALVLTVAPS
jgi:homoserine/homoserine lactone efflux protein